MNILTWIFGDRYAERFGRALLKYFEQDDFPKELLKYPELNLLYCEAQYDKTPDEYNRELINYLDAMLDMRRKELGQEAPEKSDQ